jgi:hypothetical protein
MTTRRGFGPALPAISEMAITGSLHLPVRGSIPLSPMATLAILGLKQGEEMTVTESAAIACPTVGCTCDNVHLNGIEYQPGLCTVHFMCEWGHLFSMELNGNNGQVFQSLQFTGDDPNYENINPFEGA